MSKAFSAADVPVWEPPLVLPEGRRPITPDGLAKRQANMQAYVQAHAAVAAQASSGEPALLQRLRELDGKMAVLARLLALSDVVGPAPGATVAFGSFVQVRDAEGGAHSFRLVGPDQTDAAAGWISHLSPVGRALMGRIVGDEVEVTRPKGSITYEVVAVTAYRT